MQAKATDNVLIFTNSCILISLSFARLILSSFTHWRVFDSLAHPFILSLSRPPISRSFPKKYKYKKNCAVKAQPQSNLDIDFFFIFIPILLLVFYWISNRIRLPSFVFWLWFVFLFPEHAPTTFFVTYFVLLQFGSGLCQHLFLILWRNGRLHA